MKLEPNQSILFQGDSITDCGRERAAQDPNDGRGLGNGYVGLLGAALRAQYPDHGLRIFNRGVSGHRIVDLYARWKVDAINLQPDWISILVGVNDTWHEFGSRNGVALDRYEQVYRMLLEDTRKHLPAGRLVLCEPFVLRCGVVTEEWEDDIRGRQEIVLRLAGEFDALHVPFQDMFDRALSEAPPAHWAGDGVHPTRIGHERMAEFWRACVGI